MKIPSSEAEPERYGGRPLILILENYVLDVIGELDTVKQNGISAIVAKAFGAGPDWRATIRRELRLEPAIDGNLREMWKANQQIAVQSNVPLSPIQFAKMVVDANFADHIDPIRRGDVVVRVECRGRRPSLNELVRMLWGSGADVDSDGNATSPDDQNWTELTVENRQIRRSRVDVDPVSEQPLVLEVRADNEDLAHQVARLIAEFSGGSVLL